MTPISPLTRATHPPPVMEARRWLAGATFPPERPLLNLSQAAPVDPPPEAMRAAMGEMLAEPGCHLYGPVLGLPELRAEIAARWSAAYGGQVDAADVAITAGCNMAFCAAMATIAAAGDAVMLPVPWYFNHKMWLDLMGIETVPLPCGPDMTPDPEAARARMGRSVKAIVLVTPNNPTGAEYPAELVAAFAGIARAGGAALVLDETYRDFDGRIGAPHGLFADPDWREVLVHLYSFSKAFRLTGHRVGALVAAPERLAEAEKFLDTVAICAPQLGQRAALWGLRNLGDWVAGERAEILRRRAAVREVFAGLRDWELLGCGAYFAYVRHPFPTGSDALAQRMLREASLLMLPGTMFGPTLAEGGDGAPERELRIAFANAGVEGIAEMGRRLGAHKREHYL
ncbi:MAG: aminotransferase [Rhodobacteraceae bacterium]|nr:aminotransferase [Paracoccaceae bacterium]